MKKGDLIQLSAAGIKVQGNWRCKERGGFGIVKEVWEHSMYPYVVEWWSEDMIKSHNCRFKRYELKKYKPDKK
jgi:hypothetical protein